MDVERPGPDLAIVYNRPVFVPAFGLVFVLAGLASLVNHALEGRWSTNDVFGIVVSVGLGGWLFLYTARRDVYRFDASSATLAWDRRSLWKRDRGSMPLDEIEMVFVYEGPQPNSGTYCVNLHTKTYGVLPLEKGFSAGEKRRREVKQAIDEVLERAA